jgi:hypothetical protein
MSAITEALVVLLNVKYFSFHDFKHDHQITWTDSGHGKKKLFYGHGSYVEFDSEYEAWVAAIAHYPTLLQQLAESPHLGFRAYAPRAEMLLGMGVSRFQDLKESVEAEILRIHDVALEVLDATRVTKARAKVVRVSQGNCFSWLDVRSKITTPFLAEPLLCSIRCFPSPIEDKTWSVRVRIPTSSETEMLAVQNRIEELHARLRYRGITVKDVQHGTALDL